MSWKMSLIVVGTLSAMIAAGCKSSSVGGSGESSGLASLQVNAPATSQIPYSSYMVSLTMLKNSAGSTTGISTTPQVTKFGNNTAANTKSGTSITVPAGTYNITLAFYASTDTSGTALYSSDFCTGTNLNSKNIVLFANKTNTPSINVCNQSSNPTNTTGSANVVLQPVVVNVNNGATTQPTPPTSTQPTTCSYSGKNYPINSMLCPVDGATDVLICNAPADGSSAPTFGMYQSCVNGCSTTTSNCNAVVTTPPIATAITCKDTVGITYNVGAQICGTKTGEIDVCSANGTFIVQTMCTTGNICSLTPGTSAPTSSASCQVGGAD